MGLFDRLRGSDGPRVAFFGIDGVPFSLIDDHPEVFPELTAMRTAGAGAAIDSIVPPESSACWPSLTTGVNPGSTGVYGFQDREIGSYETYVPIGRDVQATRVWDRVTDAGRQATVMNVPVTFPPQREIQRMVSGFLSPGLEQACHPAALEQTLSEIGYRIDVNATLGRDGDLEAFLADAHETLERRYEAFDRYVTEDDWDLFFGVFMTTDRVNHFFFEDYERDGEYYEEFLEFYGTVDTYLGKLRAALPDDVTTIVASDHGFTTLDYEVHLNRWLEREGWLTFATDDHEQLTDIADETRAYALIPGRLYLNLEDREPRGSVSRDVYRETLAELEMALLDLEGPDGEQVIERVVRGREVFQGNHDAIAPDLVALPTNGFDLKAGYGSGGPIFDRGPRNGMHTFENATLFTDNPQLDLTDVDLYDVTPTILDLMEIEYDGEAFDGRSLV